MIASERPTDQRSPNKLACPPDGPNAAPPTRGAVDAERRLLDEAERWIDINRNPAKRVLLHGETLDMASACELEAQTFAGLFGSEDQRGGMKAFIEKTKPVFHGR